jgi:transcriptional/translational regulatory protein YebC/TACO1
MKCQDIQNLQTLNIRKKKMIQQKGKSLQSLWREIAVAVKDGGADTCQQPQTQRCNC